ncbi:MAG TPA: hypothetical protein VK788_24260 [Terriglobales bacterium]|nr:hypothetical protein [Terriglobales bacterium]
MLAVAAVLGSSLAAQTSVPNVIFRAKCDTGLPRFEDWYRETRLGGGEPYVAVEGRKQHLMNNYPKLKLQMSVADVEKLLGKPDFATGTPVPRLADAPEPADTRCNVQTAYILRKNGENMTDTEDIAIYLSFARNGKLFWAAPQNVPNLKPVGSPTDTTPVLTQQDGPTWKEYVFAADGFAITLPANPHPHPDATLPDVTVYTVSLPPNANLSLRVSHQDRDCASTLAQLKEGGLQGKANIDPASVKDVAVAGHQGVEYQYKVSPNFTSSDRFYCVNGKFYIFSIRWLGNEEQPSTATRVVGSFRPLNNESSR